MVRTRHGVRTRRDEAAQFLEALLADPPGRDVEHPLVADLIGVVAQDPQVRQRVLDLAALIEARPADELVADAVAQERLFNGAALGVRPVHDRDVAPLPVLDDLVRAAGQDRSPTAG